MATMEGEILTAVKQRQDEFKANLECAATYTPPSTVHVLHLFNAVLWLTL